jgi:diguanylate cyclase (GGDEF)-like protein
VGERVRLHLGAQKITWGEVTFSLTVSGGIACAVPTAGTTIDDLLERADEALYQAKELGRNRICVAHDPRRDGHATLPA